MPADALAPRSPEHQQAWCWLCRTDIMHCCSTVNFIYLGQANSKIWLKKQFIMLRVNCFIHNTVYIYIKLQSFHMKMSRRIGRLRNSTLYHKWLTHIIRAIACKAAYSRQLMDHISKSACHKALTAIRLASSAAVASWPGMTFVGLKNLFFWQNTCQTTL